MLSIGVDLDGVCARYNDYLRHVVADHTSTPAESYPEPEFYSFVQSGWPLKDEKEYAEVHCAAVADGMYKNLDSIPGATRTLHALSNDGHHLRVITSRFVRPGQHAIVCSDTVEWLDHAMDENHQPITDENGHRLSYDEAVEQGHNAHRRVPYTDIAFTALKHEVERDVYIDDSPSNIYNLSTKTDGLVIIFNTPYNKRHEEYGILDEYGYRVYGWDDDCLDTEGQALAAAGKQVPTVKSFIDNLTETLATPSKDRDKLTTEQIARLDELASLETGWLYDTGCRVTPQAIRAAESVLAHSNAMGLKLPGVFPHVEGGIEIEWGDSNMTEVSVSSNGVAVFYSELHAPDGETLDVARADEKLPTELRAEAS